VKLNPGHAVSNGNEVERFTFKMRLDQSSATTECRVYQMLKSRKTQDADYVITQRSFKGKHPYVYYEENVTCDFDFRWLHSTFNQFFSMLQTYNKWSFIAQPPQINEQTFFALGKHRSGYTAVYTRRGVTRFDGARGKEQVWRPHVRP